MWILPADRRILLDVFGKDPSARHLKSAVRAPSSSSELPKNAELLLVWAADPSRSGPQSSSGTMFLPSECLPEAIVVRDEEMREFIAWATTVIGGFRPFTAFIKVIDRDQAALALEPKEPSLRGFENALVGLILGETSTLSANQRSLSTLPLLPCQSTYSYSFARAFALGYVGTGADSDPISTPLALARRLTRQPNRKLGDEPLQAALRIVAGLSAGASSPPRPNVPNFIWESCRELQAQGEVQKSWSLLEDHVGSFGQVGGEMKGPREHRVRTFERVLKETSKLDPLTSSFLAGLLADQIAPGTFEHVDLLAPYLNQYPTALAWYGLCAGLNPDSDVQQVGNCLGRRLVRELLVPDPIVSRPKHDISVRELEVYLDREAPLEFRVASQNHVAVELLPGVPAYMKWPVRDALSGEPISNYQREAFPKVPRQQVDLPLKLKAGDSLSGERSSLPDRQFALKEFERAYERIKELLDGARNGGPDGQTDDGGNRKRRKGR